MTTTDPTDGHKVDDDAPRRPLGMRFRWLLTAAGSANLADGIVSAALPLLAVRLTRSPALVAGITLAAGLPWLLTTLHAGALADRLDRRRTMLLANLARGVILAAFAGAVAFDLDRIWLLYAVAFGLGIAETLHDTSAQSFLPQLVGRDQLARANGRLFGVEFGTNNFAGPPLGSLAVAAAAVVAVALPAALFLLAALALARIRGQYRPDRAGPATTLVADVKEGLAVLWRHDLLRTLAIMVGVMNLAINAVFAVLVLFVVGPDAPMGQGELGYGVLLAVTAAGSLLASLVAERVEARLGRAWLMRLGVASVALAPLVAVLTTDVWLVGAGFAAFGAGSMLWNVVVVSFRQGITADHLLGRVNASFRLVAFGTLPIGAALAAVVGELYGVRAVFATAAALAAMLLVVRITDARLDAAEPVGR